MNNLYIHLISNILSEKNSSQDVSVFVIDFIFRVQKQMVNDSTFSNFKSENAVFFCIWYQAVYIKA